jgi:hypothetical protein
MLKVPTPQGTAVPLVDPAAGQAYPAGHREHALTPVTALNWPGLHSVALPDPGGQAEPAGQTPLQTEDCVAPTTELKTPPGHGVQLVLPAPL